MVFIFIHLVNRPEKYIDDVFLLFIQGYFVKDNILEDGGKSILFGVFDGHGKEEI